MPAYLRIITCLLLFMGLSSFSKGSLWAAQAPPSPVVQAEGNSAVFSGMQQFLAKKAGKMEKRIQKQVRAQQGSPEGLGIAALAAGVLTWVAFLAFTSPISLLLGPVAIGLGIFSLLRLRRRDDLWGRGFGIAGLVLGGAFLAFITALLISFALAF